MSTEIKLDGVGSQFFDDQDVLSEDLSNVEYTKLDLIRKTVQATMSSYGVCAMDNTSNALLVSLDDQYHFTVSNGSAIDGYGKLIYVPVDTSASGSITTDPLYHPAWPDREYVAHGKTDAGTYYVHIAHAVQEDILDTDDTGTQYYKRAYDSYSITVTDQSSGSGNSVVLASFAVDSVGRATNLMDRRTFYTAAVPNSVSLTGHQAYYHENGLGDRVPPVYADGYASAWSDGSLGITISQAGTSATAIFNDISSFLNLDGNYLTGTLGNYDLTWVDADTTGYYVIYIDTSLFIRRTSVGDYSDARATGTFPLFMVHWSDSNVLTIISDLRKWNVADTWVGNSQFSSGSLTLNSGSLGRVKRTSLNFRDPSAALYYEDSVFHFTKDVSVDDDLVVGVTNGYYDIYCAHNYYANYEGSARDTYLYLDYYSGTPTRQKYLMWSNINSRFEFNDDLYISGSINSNGLAINGDLSITGDLSVGGIIDEVTTSTVTATASGSLFNTLTTTGNLRVGGNGRVDGGLTIYGSCYVVDDVSVSGNGQIKGPLYLGEASSTAGDAAMYWNFPYGSSLTWNVTSLRFEFANKVYMPQLITDSAIISELSGSIATDGDVYSNTTHNLSMNTIGGEITERSASNDTTYEGFMWIYSGAKTITFRGRVKYSGTGTTHTLKIRIASEADSGGNRTTIVESSAVNVPSSSYSWITITFTNLPSYLTVGTAYAVQCYATTSGVTTVYVNDYVIAETA